MPIKTLKLGMISRRETLEIPLLIVPTLSLSNSSKIYILCCNNVATFGFPVYLSRFKRYNLKIKGKKKKKEKKDMITIILNTIHVTQIVDDKNRWFKIDKSCPIYIL